MSMYRHQTIEQNCGARPHTHTHTHTHTHIYIYIRVCVCVCVCVCIDRHFAWLKYEACFILYLNFTEVHTNLEKNVIY
jgi:hypothetical protein